MFKGERVMKKLMLVGLLTMLISVPIGNALAEEASTEPEPNNLGDSGVYAYFPIVPSGFGGFDSLLYLTGFAGEAPSLEINSLAVGLPGSVVQTSNVDLNRLQVAVLSSASTKGILNFRCEPQPRICQVFIHRQDRGAGLNFTATLGVFANNAFQFIQPYFFVVP